MTGKYKKAEFATSASTYDSNRLVYFVIMGFAIFVCLPFICVALIGLMFAGPNAGVLFFLALPLLVAGSFVFVMSKALKGLAEDWPVCKKHGLRMVITGRKQLKGGNTLLTFTCPKKDSKVEMISEPSGGGHGFHHGGFHHGFHHGGGGHFGGGHSGGGGAGR